MADSPRQRDEGFSAVVTGVFCGTKVATRKAHASETARMAVGSGGNINNFDSSACVPEPGNDSPCPAFDRLIGSRLLVGNLEFRMPLLRLFGASPRMYGPLPVEVVLFADSGVAWNSLQQTRAVAGTTFAPTAAHAFRLSDRVSSTGVALRVNLGGFALGEFDFVRPLDLPRSGWGSRN